MDFFSILLPSALLTWLMMAELGPIVLGRYMEQRCKATNQAHLILRSQHASS